MPDPAVARMLLVDLAVVATELVRADRPPYPPGANTRARFEHWYQFGQRLFHLAIETGIETEGLTIQPDELAPLVGALGDSGLLHQLRDAAIDVFSDINYEYGFVHVAQSWSELCAFLSSLVFLRGLLHRHPKLSPDTTELERLMERWGEELYKPLDARHRMPDAHWWWYGSAPA
jgi:hypothetical protein